MNVSAPQVSSSPRREGWIRSSAQVSYESIRPQSEIYWFEIPAATAEHLNQSGDPWLAAALPMAAALGEPLQIEAPTDPILAEGAGEIMRIWTDWGFIPNPVPLKLTRSERAAEPRTRGTATFFSGGVDSFFTLLHAQEHPRAFGAPKTAVFIHGFDIALNQEGAYEAAFQNAQEACRQLGVELMTVATNLRHTSWNLLDWERLAHGPLLAACGHVLSRGVDTLLVPSGWVPRYLRPWASHPETDPLLSGSELRLVHYQHHLSRREKTRYLTSYPVALDHLRVCWKSDRGDNCHRCYKCLRTMATLEVFDALDDSAAFRKGEFDLRLFDDLDLGQLVEYFPDLQAIARERAKHEIASAIGRAVEHTHSLHRQPWRQLSAQLGGWIRLRPRLRQRLRRLRGRLPGGHGTGDPFREPA